MFTVIVSLFKLCGSVALWLCGKTSYILNDIGERAPHSLEVVSGVNQKG